MEQQTAALKAVLTALLVAKRDGTPSEEFQALLTQGSLTILELKALHRALAESTEALRETTAAAKTSLDHSNLQLQNLLYEKGHYQKEIRACLSFKSAYSDPDIDLQPVDVFLAASPQHQELGTGEEGAHKLMLARLEHEIAGRKAVLQELNQLKARKDAVAAELAVKKRFLDSLASELGSVADVTQGLRGALGLVPQGAPLPPLVALLPLPLYILYSQVLAVQQAVPPVVPLELKLSGSLEVARAWAAGAPLPDPEPEPPGEAELDAGDDATAVAGGAAATGAEAPEDGAVVMDMDQPTIKAHPLSVIIRLQRETGKTLSLSLQYLPSLHLVTAQSAEYSDAPTLAAVTVPDAAGVRLAGAGEAAAIAGATVEATRPDRPFKWAQYLAGIDFVPFPVEGAPQPALQHVGAGVLVGLSQYRAESRALAVLLQLRAARPKSAGSSR